MSMFYRALSRLLVAIFAVAVAGLWAVAAARSVGEPGQPATVTVNPLTATNEVGQQHCPTATVRDITGAPVPGVMVLFQVGPSVPSTFPNPSSGEAMTGADGTTPYGPPDGFCYTVSLPGTDTIRATVVGGTAAPTTLGSTAEPFGEGTKVWRPPVSTQMCEADITGGGWFVADNLDRVNFGGNAMSDSNSTPSGQEEYQDQPAQMDVHSIDITAVTCTPDRTSASIFGDATINGSGKHVFRIDVTDVNGVNDTYGIMLDTGYVSGQHTLMGGNITIH
jgi:hypothetical protein